MRPRRGGIVRNKIAHAPSAVVDTIQCAPALPIGAERASRLIFSWRDRIKPTQSLKSRKIAIREAERQPEFDCQCSEVSVGDEVTVNARAQGIHPTDQRAAL